MTAAPQDGGRRDGLVDLVGEEEVVVGKRRGALLAVAALVGFGLGLEGVRELGPPYLEDSFVAARFEAFADFEDETQLLFIGNSRVNHHIDPALVDEALSEADYPLRSFNFGIGAMNAVETSYVLEEVLDEASPVYVVLDPGDLRTRPRGNNSRSERFVRWHDLRRTHWVWEHFYASVADAEKREKYFEPHLRAFWYRTFNIGRGPRMLKAGFRTWCAWGVDRTGCAAALRYRDHVALLRRTRGFVGLHDGLGAHEFFEPAAITQVRKNRAAFLEMPEDAMARVRKRLIAKRKKKKFLLPAMGRDMLERVHEQCAEHGSRLTFMLNPRPDTNADYMYPAVEEGLAPRLVDYSDPVAHPSFYAASQRFEGSHLHRSATPAFARELVADLLEVWSAP